MSDPNEPRLMKSRGNEPRNTNDITTGDAGRDGFTRIARRRLPGDMEGAGDVPYSMYGSGGIHPQVGERDYNRGPRFEEDC
jgi:hypothetical protein